MKVKILKVLTEGLKLALTLNLTSEMFGAIVTKDRTLATVGSSSFPAEDCFFPMKENSGPGSTSTACRWPESNLSYLEGKRAKLKVKRICGVFVP